MAFPDQGPPGASGYAGYPQAQQQLPAQPQQGGYDIDHLPPSPQQQRAAQQQQQGQQQGQPQWNQPQQQGQFTQQPTQSPDYGWQNPRGQVPQQMQPPAQRQPVQLDDTAILDGPAVPAELRGRSWGEARRLYTALSNDWLQRNRAAQQSAAQAPQAQMPSASQAQQPMAQTPVQPQFNGQTPAQASAPFWQNPDQRISELVGQAIQQNLGPVIQQNQAQGIAQARNVAATGMADFQYLEPDIMQIVAGTSPADLQNPNVWMAAARMARGQQMEAGLYRPPAQQQPQRGGPGSSVPAYQQQPQQPVHSFFSESPTAPNVPSGYGTQGGSQQATQEDQYYANKFQMPVGDFMAWKYGTQGGGSF